MNENLIYDIGFHNGDDTAYFLYRGFKVVAIDANPNLVEAGQQRFASEISAGQLKLLNVGITASAGVTHFWVHEGNSEWSSFVKDFGCRDGGPCHSISVPCLPLQEILEEHGVPLYLKVDIEGHDELCIADLDPRNSPLYVSVEFGPVENIDRLVEKGYSSFKIVNQKNHNDPATQSFTYDRLDRRILRLFRQRRNVHGRLQDGSWSFHPGCSGPFGEDAICVSADGEWLTEEQAKATMQAHRSGERPLPRGWFDLHARRQKLSEAKKAA